MGEQRLTWTVLWNEFSSPLVSLILFAPLDPSCRHAPTHPPTSPPLRQHQAKNADPRLLELHLLRAHCFQQGAEIASPDFAALLQKLLANATELEPEAVRLSLINAFACLMWSLDHPEGAARVISTLGGALMRALESEMAAVVARQQRKGGEEEDDEEEQLREGLSTTAVQVFTDLVTVFGHAVGPNRRKGGDAADDDDPTAHAEGDKDEQAAHEAMLARLLREHALPVSQATLEQYWSIIERKLEAAGRRAAEEHEQEEEEEEEEEGAAEDAEARRVESEAAAARLLKLPAKLVFTGAVDRSYERYARCRQLEQGGTEDDTLEEGERALLAARSGRLLADVKALAQRVAHVFAGVKWVMEEQPPGDRLAYLEAALAPFVASCRTPTPRTCG
eukprot:jgi/Mesvir1/21084/Mv08157-RA.1